jgi:hypothetical protein
MQLFVSICMLDAANAKGMGHFGKLITTGSPIVVTFGFLDQAQF